MSKIKIHHKEKQAHIEIASFLKEYVDENAIIVCIGTDRCTGDCLGPLVGTLLKEDGFPLEVFGTLSEPIHALNLCNSLEKIKKLHPHKKIIAIDACLGAAESIGEISAKDSPIHPGKGVGKFLPEIGEISLIGIVDSSKSNELFTTRNIRLNLVFDMAKVIVKALFNSIHFKENSEVATA